MHFTKMHGIGNDFIVIDEKTAASVPDLHAFSKNICKRHFSVGADGVLVVGKSAVADTKMVVYNADGSIAQMCGNGLRCAALYLRTRGFTDKDTFTVETGAGILTVTIHEALITCDMGLPEFCAAKIPVAGESNRITLSLEGQDWSFFCVSMGNPHAVTFDRYPDRDEFLRLGKLAETASCFPERANVEFCRVRGNDIDVRVWERGDGETLACGTGASAVLSAANALGLIGRSAQVHLPGGVLNMVLADNGHVFMTGPAEFVCEGEL